MRAFRDRGRPTWEFRSWLESEPAKLLGVLLLIAAMLWASFTFANWNDRRRAAILADELQKRGVLPTETRK